MVDVFPRGSEWRKWDLQIHTPASHLNNGFGSDWDQYIQGLFRTLVARQIAVVGVTDYFTIDGYKKIRDYLEDDARLAALLNSDEILKIRQIRFFPNVEFRLNRFVGNSRLNCHVIFSDEVSVGDIEDHFLHDLNFTYQNEPQQTAEKRRLKVDNLEQLGKKLKADHASFAEEGTDIYVGMMNAVVDDELISSTLGGSRFTGKYLFAVVADEDLPSINWNSQDHHARKILIQKSDILFSSNAKTRNWALARPPQYQDGEVHFRREFSTLKACVHGSDAHRQSEVAHPCSKRGQKGHVCETSPEDCNLRYCWIKADPTFEGLRQILFEPADRVFIGPTPPDYHDSARVIKAVRLRGSGGWFEDVEIPLNQGLVSVIGQKGSGKSALAELIAYAAGSWEESEQTGFINRASGLIDNLEVELVWDDGATSSVRMADDKSEEDRVRYLSQNFVERLCAQDGVGEELIREIENVIFSYLDPIETYNSSDFAELRAMKTSATNQEGERLKAEIRAVIRRECNLRINAARAA